MAHLVEVSFKGNRREFFTWEAEEIPAVRAAVIVDADRGEDLGFVHSTGDLAVTRNAGTPHGTGDIGPARKIRRLASPEDVQRAEELRAAADEARRTAVERVRANQLVMKLSDAEWQWDRKKLTFYFTADKRVDFRTLVRELASLFRTRIELKQIGVRDEAKRLDGIGRCGRQYCSASWLPELRPVNLGVAKDQRLSLNPSQISGACGRLMCCLRYEHEFYVSSRKRFPKEGRILRTALGEQKVVANDIFRDRVTLRSDDGETRIVTLEDLRAEVEAAGGSLPAPSAAVVDRRPPTARALPSDEDAVPETVDSDLSGTVVAPPRAAARGQSSPTERPDTEPASPEASDRKPARRRGRRGGRRNRGGRPDAPDGSSPSSDE